MQISQYNHCYSNASVVPPTIINHRFPKRAIQQEKTTHLVASTTPAQGSKLGKNNSLAPTPNPESLALLAHFILQWATNKIATLRIIIEYMAMALIYNLTFTFTCKTKKKCL